jgi:NAD-dependent dihydropyrimidine dehydrogenase PreA subunit
VFLSEVRWRRTGIQLGILVGAQTVFGVLRGWSLEELLLWAVILSGVVVLMSLDACGSTPLHKTSIKHWLTHGDYRSLFSPVIDPALCINCMQCVLVCPTYVFAARREIVKTVVAVRPNECEECLACVKQCPTDAIFNRSGQYKGDVKSVPRLDYLVTRDWSHLHGEDRWVGASTVVRNGLPVVIETPSDLVEPRAALFGQQHYGD